MDAVSIPERVLEALKLAEMVIGGVGHTVSIPERVLEALKLKWSDSAESIKRFNP